MITETKQYQEENLTPEQRIKNVANSKEANLTTSNPENTGFLQKVKNTFNNNQFLKGAALAAVIGASSFIAQDAQANNFQNPSMSGETQEISNEKVSQDTVKLAHFLTEKGMSDKSLNERADAYDVIDDYKKKEESAKRMSVDVFSEKMLSVVEDNYGKVELPQFLENYPRQSSGPRSSQSNPPENSIEASPEAYSLAANELAEYGSFGSAKDRQKTYSNVLDDKCNGNGELKLKNGRANIKCN